MNNLQLNIKMILNNQLSGSHMKINWNRAYLFLIFISISSCVSANYAPPTSIPCMSTLDKATISIPIEVGVGCVPTPLLKPGSTFKLTCTIDNLGTQDDTYTIAASATVPWVNTARIPKAISIPNKSSVTLTFFVIVPADQPAENIGSFDLLVTSKSNPLIMGGETKALIVGEDVTTAKTGFK